MIATPVAPADASGRMSVGSAARRNLAVIFNPAAGRGGRRILERTVQELARRDFRIDLCETAARGDAEHLAREAAGADMVIAAGGDGTLNEVLNGLADRPRPLAVLPIGTANMLATEIGMPATPSAFAEAVALAPLRQIWVGEASGRRFALVIGVGFDARVVAAVRAGLKQRLGKWAYALAALRELLRHRPARYHVRIDGESFEAAAVIVAKARFYAGRFVVAPNARATSPYLEICLLGGSRRQDVVRCAAALACGRLARQEDVVLLRGREVSIEGRAGEPVQGDGDIIASLPITVRVVATPVDLLFPKPTSPDDHGELSVAPRLRPGGFFSPKMSGPTREFPRPESTEEERYHECRSSLGSRIPGPGWAA